MNIPERHEMIDLLIKEVDGTLWSESYFFGVTDEEGDKMWEFIKEYNKDKHLDLRYCFDDTK